MLARLILLTALFLLSGCGGARKHPVAATPSPETPAAIPAHGPIGEESWTRKILDAAYGEWIFFGQQKVIIEQDEESIPHVGAWEDDDYVHIERVNEYWRAVGKGGLTGRDCQEPWSAAFISWVMRTAGIPRSEFPPSSSHWTYLTHFLTAAQSPGAVFVPHAIGEYRPKPGDLICASREKNTGPIAPDELPRAYELEGTKLHCDLVMESSGRNLQAIGGNVRNSVSKTILTLSREGYLQPTRRRPWFMVIENRLD